jgi:hypothetical protein
MGKAIIMRINDLFKIISKDRGIANSNVSKQGLYNMVRSIIKYRKTFGIRNDVAHLYANREMVLVALDALDDVIDKLDDNFDKYIDMIFDIPRVHDYLLENGMIEEEEDEDSEEDEDDDEEDDEEGSSDGTSSDVDTANEVSTDVMIKVEVTMPFSWITTIMMVASVLNLLVMAHFVVNSDPANQCKSL